VFVGTQVAQDAPRKRRRASKSAGGCVVTSDTFIADLLRRSNDDDLRDMKKAHGLTERNRSALTRSAVAASKLHEACAKKLDTYEKYLQLLPAANAALTKGERHMTVAHLQAIIVCRDGQMRHGNKAALVS
jgi:hypothetical protein